MLFINLRKALLYSAKDSSFLRKSHVFLSLYFSTVTKKEPSLTSDGVIDLLKQKHQLSPEVASRVASVLNRQKIPQNVGSRSLYLREKSFDSVLSFLEENGFSKTQLEKMLKSRPELLLASLEKTIKPKFKTLQEMGFSGSDITVIISKDPWILKYSFKKRVIPSLSVLNGLFGSSDEVAKLLINSSWFLAKDLEKTLVPNIEFLVSCGICKEQLLRFIYSFPRLFLLKPEIIKKCVEKADELGADRNSKMFIQAVRIFGSMTEETLERKLQAYRKLGFSEDEIMTIFRKAPQVFAVSLDKVKKIIEVLIATGKYDVSCIVKTPKALTSSIEKRYTPRLRVIRNLESRNLIKKWPSLTAVYLMPDEKFFEKFVEPYLNETGDVRKLKCAAAAKVKKETKVIAASVPKASKLKSAVRVKKATKVIASSVPKAEA